MVIVELVLSGTSLPMLTKTVFAHCCVARIRAGCLLRSKDDSWPHQHGAQEAPASQEECRSRGVMRRGVSQGATTAGATAAAATTAATAAARATQSKAQGSNGNSSGNRHNSDSGTGRGGTQL